MSSDGWTTIESEPGVFHQLISEFGVKGVQARMGWDAFCDGIYDLPECIIACSAQIWVATLHGPLTSVAVHMQVEELWSLDRESLEALRQVRVTVPYSPGLCAVCKFASCRWPANPQPLQPPCYSLAARSVDPQALNHSITVLLLPPCHVHRPVYGLVFLFKWTGEKDTRPIAADTLGKVFFAKQVWIVQGLPIARMILHLTAAKERDTQTGQAGYRPEVILVERVLWMRFYIMPPCAR